MLHHLKFVSNVPWIARYIWVAIMLLASMFASQWGVADAQIKTLLIINALYGVAVTLGYYFGQNPRIEGLFFGFLLDLFVWSAFIYFSGGASNPLITLYLTIISVASIVFTTRYIIAL